MFLLNCIKQETNEREQDRQRQKVPNLSQVYQCATRNDVLVSCLSSTIAWNTCCTILVNVRTIRPLSVLAENFSNRKQGLSERFILTDMLRYQFYHKQRHTLDICTRNMAIQCDIFITSSPIQHDICAISSVGYTLRLIWPPKTVIYHNTPISRYTERAMLMLYLYSSVAAPHIYISLSLQNDISSWVIGDDICINTVLYDYGVYRLGWPSSGNVRVI